MKQRLNNPEILAPAGSIDILYAALAMGADAVYVGAPKFGARAFADNPSVGELERAINYAHIHGKRIYLTVNTLLDDAELCDELIPMLDPLVGAGLDAVIVQDPGVLIRLHEAYPKLSLHASTQMALFSGEDANLLASYGVTRFVPARELTIDEIISARAKTDLEIEVFVHGALCVCYSGWCLMSECIGGRSGNRGMCAGPCRLPYTRKNCNDGSNGSSYLPRYELNSCDQQTLIHIPELVKAGVDSFKIEGRMKSREYAAYMAYLYRHYTDVFLDEGEEYYSELVGNNDSKLHRDIKRAMDIYNRGGFFSSFLFKNEGEKTIEKNVRGHYGLYVGSVKKRIKASGKPGVIIGLTEEVKPQDILAIRNDAGETVYEFTASDNTAVDEYTVNIGHSNVKVGDKVYRTKNKALLDEIDRTIDEAMDAMDVELDCVWTGRIGESASLEISGSMPDISALATGDAKQDTDDIVRVVVTGDVISRAKSRPVDDKTIADKLSMLGGSGYSFRSISVDMDEDAFIPIKSIKSLRRLAIDRWESEFADRYKRRYARIPGGETDRSADKGSYPADIPVEPYDKPDDMDISGNWISVYGIEEFTELINDNNSNRYSVICIRSEGFDADDLDRLRLWKQENTDISAADAGSRPKLAISLPRPFHGRVRDIYMEKYDSRIRELCDIFVVNSMASLVYKNKYLPDIPAYADENMYMTNRLAERFYREQGVRKLPGHMTGKKTVMTSIHKIDEGVIATPKGDRFRVCKPKAYDYRIVYYEQIGVK